MYSGVRLGGVAVVGVVVSFEPVIIWLRVGACDGGSGSLLSPTRVMGLERGGVFSDGRSGCAIVSNLLLTQLDKHVLDAGDRHERLKALSQSDVLALFELLQQSHHLAIDADIDLE